MCSLSSAVARGACLPGSVGASGTASSRFRVSGGALAVRGIGIVIVGDYLAIGVIIRSVGGIIVGHWVRRVGFAASGRRENGFYFFDGDLVEVCFVGYSSRFVLDHFRENAVIKMLIKLLSRGKCDVASAALAAGKGVCCRELAGGTGGRRPGLAVALALATVRWSLLDVVDSHQMTFEDIGTIEGLF